MGKVFFIIPGFKSQVTDDVYTWLVSHLTMLGYAVKGVPVNWGYKTVTQNAAEFLNYFNQHKSNHNYILGFSYGAVIALLTAENTECDALYLCSLSPDFKEDIDMIPPWLKTYIGINRYTDISTRSGVALAKKLVTPTTVFYGETEGGEFPQLKVRCEETVRYTKNAKLVVVKNARHDISEPEYQSAIKLTIR